MPKQVWKINQFHGGLNSSSDPRDILDSELSDIRDVMIDNVGTVRTIGSVTTHDIAEKQLDNTGASASAQVPGSGLFYFSHDRIGGEDAGDDEDETGDEYLALYDDSDVQVWVYSLATDDWDDDKDSNENGVINFIGKTTSAAARPCFTSIDGVVRVSTGELSKYASGSLINDGSHFLSTDTVLIVDNSSHFAQGNYLQIEDEIVFIAAAIGSVNITVRRAMFGTKAVQHNDNTPIYIVNMNQWYGYLDNKFFQTGAGVTKYSTSKWHNGVQHIRSLDELGITLVLHDAASNSPTSSEIDVVNKIVIAYWLADDGFWIGSYWIGVTPIYVGGQEGPISTVGSTPIQMHEKILNIQLYITHPDIDDTDIVTADGHPLLDDRIIGINLYTKSYTSDEWYLLQNFDLTKGGEHGWETYNSDAGANVTSAGGNTLAGFWKTSSTADSLTLANPTSTESYDGADASTNQSGAANTCTATLDLEESKGSDRKGILRLSGFNLSPLYKEVSLSSTSSQAMQFDVINPAPGKTKFVVELLDENFNIMKRTENEFTIGDSGASPPFHDEDGGYGSSSGGSS